MGDKGGHVLDTVDTPSSPDWWLMRLGNRLHHDRPRLDTLHDYWAGRHPLPFGNQNMRETYRRFQTMARTNFMSLVAESLLERLRVVGFRAGGDKTEANDRAAWGWWQANDMDAVAGLVHRAAVVMGRSYVIVGVDPDDADQPLITGEDPRQVIHETDPANRRKVLAAAKTWWDDVARRHRAVLYLPDSIHYYTSVRTTEEVDSQLWQSAQWNVADDPRRNPLDEVPVVAFRNRPNLCGETQGEFEDVVDIQDRINVQVLDRLVISTMQAYRQRWGIGVDVTDEQGRPQAPFDPGADLLWAVPDEKAKFGDFAQSDLSGVLNAVESDVHHLGAITRTPPHYLLGAIVNAAGEALAAAETGLCAKADERINEYSASWEAVYRLAGVITGVEVGTDAEAVWANPQFRSLNEKAAASVQLLAAGVPWRTRMTVLDFTPQEIDRMVAEKVQDAMVAAALAQATGMDESGAPGGRTPPQPTGNGSQFSMRAGPGSSQGGAAAPQANLARATAPR
jgi:hypothetical protein